jgi:4-amino-4-deoxy-L-arabinose transferase-like glycosyltransferase
MDRRRWLLTMAFLLALGARLAFALGYWVEKPLTLDEQEYLALARNLAAGRGLVYDADGREHFGRAPGYPAFLGVVFGLGGGTRTYKVAQSFIGALTALVIAALARLAAGSRAEILAAFLAAVYPPLVWIAAYPLSEALFSALELASGLLLWIALRRERTAGNSAYVAAGVIGGLAALVRPAGLPYVALVLAFLVLRPSLSGALAMALGVALVIAPWAAFKTRAAGRLVLIASESGVTFWTGNHPLAIGEGDMAANPRIREANQALRASHPGLSPDELEAVYYREAKEFIVRHPLAWGTLIARKFFYLWVPIGPSYTLHSSRYYGATLASYLGILPFALVGWWKLWQQAVPAAPLWLLGASVVFTCLVFSPQERFRIPVLDPVMIVGASAALAGRGDRRPA